MERVATGSLLTEPRVRTGARGIFATAYLSIRAGDAEPLIVPVIASSTEAVSTLAALSTGVTVAVAGPAKLRTWQRNGETKTGLSMIVDRVMTSYSVTPAAHQESGA